MRIGQSASRAQLDIMHMLLSFRTVPVASGTMTEEAEVEIAPDPAFKEHFNQCALEEPLARLSRMARTFATSDERNMHQENSQDAQVKCQCEHTS